MSKSNIIIDREFGQYRFVRSIGNIDVLFDKKHCYIPQDNSWIFSCTPKEIAKHKERGIDDTQIELFKEKSIKLSFLREIIFEDWHILFYFSSEAYVLLSFHKDEGLFVPYLYTLKPFGESQLKQCKEFDDKTFIVLSEEWRKNKIRVLNELLDNKHKKYKLKISHNGSVSSLQCLECGALFDVVYDSECVKSVVCHQCNSKMSIHSDVTLDITVRIED